MLCRLLSQIFRVPQIYHFRPVLQKIMLNAFPNNNSLIRNTTTSFYTILTSNIHKNYNLAKQRNILKCSAHIKSDINYNKQNKKTKLCKTKKKIPKLKYTEIRICKSEDKCKEKMICICMPLSKFKEIRSKTNASVEEQKKIRKFINNCTSTNCASRQQQFRWVPLQKKPCPVKTWIMGVPPKSHFKPNKLYCKSSQTIYLMKSRSSIDYSTPSKNPSNCCAPHKQIISTNYCAPTKQTQSTILKMATKTPGSVNCCALFKEADVINSARLKQAIETNCAQFKQIKVNNDMQPKQISTVTQSQPKQIIALNCAQPKQISAINCAQPKQTIALNCTQPKQTSVLNCVHPKKGSTQNCAQLKQAKPTIMCPFSKQSGPNSAGLSKQTVSSIICSQPKQRISKSQKN